MSSKFLVFGSVLTKGGDAGDIDLVAVEKWQDGIEGIGLGRYEELSRRTGKPVDLFLHMPEEGLVSKAYYDLTQWTIIRTYWGRFFFLDLRPMSYEELVELATGAAAASGLKVEPVSNRACCHDAD
jgi:hypothetical protein